MQQVLSPATTPPRDPAFSGYRVDPGRGPRDGRVSSEWFSRPADERFLSLSDLHTAVKVRADQSRARTVETRDLRVEAARDNPETPSPRAAGRARADRPDPLELRPVGRSRRRPGRLPARPPGADRRHQPAIRPEPSPYRDVQGLYGRRPPHRAAGRHGPGLRPHPRS